MSRFFSPNQQFMAGDGTPLIGGFLFFYLTGTSTPENTYSDQNLTIPNANPIELDANGYAGSIFLATGVQYKVVLTDSNDVQQWTEDPVGDEPTSGATFANAVDITAAPDFTKTVRFQTNGVDRASIGIDASPETGSNAGSNGALIVYSDAGSQLFSIYTWNRATGILDFSTGVPTVGGVPLLSSLQPQGRLSLATATPVMATTVSGATIVYYTPYLGQNAPIFNGSSFAWTNLRGELSQATTDTTNSPSAVASSSVYDLFVWIKNGAPTLSRGPAWTNSTTRSLALTRVQGILVNSAGITNGPGAQLGTYVGTIASNSASTIDWIYGGSASGGAAASFNVWNAFNRVAVGGTVIDSGSGYQSVPSSYQQARASVGNQINFVSGLAEDNISVSYGALQQFSTSTGGVTFDIAIGINSTTVPAISREIDFSIPAGGFQRLQAFIAGNIQPQLGSGFFSAMEKSSSTSTSADVDGANTLSADFRM